VIKIICFKNEIAEDTFLEYNRVCPLDTRIILPAKDAKSTGKIQFYQILFH
jgi:hypothetical protein